MEQMLSADNTAGCHMQRCTKDGRLAEIEDATCCRDWVISDPQSVTSRGRAGSKGQGAHASMGEAAIGLPQGVIRVVKQQSAE